MTDPITLKAGENRDENSRTAITNKRQKWIENKPKCTPPPTQLPQDISYDMDETNSNLISSTTSQGKCSIMLKSIKNHHNKHYSSLKINLISHIDYTATLLACRSYNKHDEQFKKFILDLHFETTSVYFFHHNGNSHSQIYYVLSTQSELLDQYKTHEMDPVNTSSGTCISANIRINLNKKSTISIKMEHFTKNSGITLILKPTNMNLQI
ncbi:unnamed protein product [Mytilus coruscus]|uniref:Uncharacterized protein n=1 Tax=Mytilus coruscus TaxID=42192 RepID=A0A6J8BCY9_MYTCO|nr:unnamed protein product [Mytilus coruscus]